MPDLTYFMKCSMKGDSDRQFSAFPHLSPSWSSAGAVCRWGYCGTGGDYCGTGDSAAPGAKRVPVIRRRRRTMSQFQVAGIMTEGNGIIDQAAAESLITMATSLWIISFSLLFFASSISSSSISVKKMVFFFFL